MNFNSIDHLVMQLKQFDAEPLVECFSKCIFRKKRTPESIIYASVDKSIYRAFRYETPSERFRNWRLHKAAKRLLEKLNDVDSQDDFDAILYSTAESLVEDWGDKNERGDVSRMNIGISLKITNIIFKHLTLSGLVTNCKLIKLLHVPWDSYTLKPIANIFGKDIPTPLGQGSIKNQDLYKDLHSFISDISIKAEVPRIHYELMVWDEQH